MHSPRTHRHRSERKYSGIDTDIERTDGIARGATAIAAIHVASRNETCL
jgi:predicted phosphoribosyltransferase